MWFGMNELKDNTQDWDQQFIIWVDCAESCVTVVNIVLILFATWKSRKDEL